MATQEGYYRHPSVHGDAIVFVCENDLWRVPRAGGVARRLTAGPGHLQFPVLSPDGLQVAFAADLDGPIEVYVMDAEGGPPKRLTWLGSTTHPVGWAADGSAVIVASDWHMPFLKSVHLHSVPLDGSPHSPLNHGPARAISFEPGGPGVVIGRNSNDPARWKRYRGGTAGTLWIDRRGSGEFAQLLKVEGNLANPMWIDGRIYFLSDHEGFGNIYSCTPTGRSLKRHTHHEDFFARFPATDGSAIVYHKGADLHLYDVEAGEGRPLDISIHSSRPQRLRKFVSASQYFESFELHPDGHTLASVHRGGVYTMPLWEGAPTRFGRESGVRYRLATWLPDGERLACVTDETGEEALVVIDTTGERRQRSIDGDFGRPIEMAVAPRGPLWLALTNQRQQLMLVDLKSGRSSVVDTSDWGEIEGIAWSPDGRYLAYAFPATRRAVSIRVVEVATGKIHPVTRPEFRDERPAFDPAGRYLYFISGRVFDPVYDSHYFDLGFPRGSKPFLVTLRAETPSPFSAAHRQPRPPMRPSPNGAAAQNGRARPGHPEEVEIDIDFAGIEDRVVAFPVPEGRYARVEGTHTRVLFSSYPVRGSLDTNWGTQVPTADGTLESYDFEMDKVDVVSAAVTDFCVSPAAQTVAIRSGNRLRVLPSLVQVEQLSNETKPGRETGWVELDRISVAVVPGDEWRQMFREAWRLQRDQFWTPDMAGIDWQAIHDRYLPLVDRVATRTEFSDLMWELQGELGTSHCYELGGDYRRSPQWHVGFLGADLALDQRSGRWRVERIPQGDSWMPESFSPLRAPGVGVSAGDEILAVNGEPVGREASPYERLVHRAGEEVQLTVGSRRGRRARQRVVTVRTLKSELELRYRDWVETNRRAVHEATGDRVGYVHIPNMGPVGYSEFHRYYGSEVDRDGLVVDVRYNGGGHVSQLLLEKLLRRRVAWDKRRWGVPDAYPADAPAGPMVALTNEYAGSDGDIFSHCFKLYGLGPLIGKRTWGGVIGIWPRHALVDGALTTQPEFAFWLEDVGWGVENFGTTPDIEVEMRPQDYAADRDPQLDRALVEVMRLVKRHGPQLPEFKAPPILRPGRLPAAR